MAIYLSYTVKLVSAIADSWERCQLQGRALPCSITSCDTLSLELALLLGVKQW